MRPDFGHPSSPIPLSRVITTPSGKDHAVPPGTPGLSPNPANRFWAVAPPSVSAATRQAANLASWGGGQSDLYIGRA